MALSGDKAKIEKQPESVPQSRKVSKGASHEHLTGGVGVQVRFRPNRYHVEELGSLSWTVSISQHDGSQYSCRLLDIAAGGIGIILPQSMVLRVNETLPAVVITYDENLAYSGKATVATLRERDGEPFAGLHFIDGILEVSNLLDLREIKKAGNSLCDELTEKQAGWHVEGYSLVKGLISDFRLFLEDTESSLHDIERNLPWHVVFGETNSPVRQSIRDSFLVGPAKTFCNYFSSIDKAVRDVDQNDIEVLKQLSRRHLNKFILQGALFSRSLEKPRGYAGDYATMNYIYGRHFVGSSLFGQFVHMAGCQHDVCQAVRNRKDLLRDLIGNCVRNTANEKAPRIASIGSGPAEEFYELLQFEEAEQHPFNVVLFDVDDEALNYCFPRLTAEIQKRGLTETVDIMMLYDSVAHLLFDDSVFRDTGPFDLIVCAGLYDYLPRKKAQMLTLKLYSQLASGGTLVIGNMTPVNSSRWAMEHLAEWHLLYRESDELDELRAGIPQDATVEMLSEPLGINLFLKIRKAGNGHLDYH